MMQLSTSMISFVPKLLVLVTILASTNGATITVTPPGTIQAAITTASGGDTILVSAGTYTENIQINKQLTLLSVSGRDSTTIQGISSAPGLPVGTIVVPAGINGVNIGGTGQGFTIIGIDNASPGIENAAVYFQAGHDGAVIKDNEIVAAGDAGLITEFGGTVKNFLIDGNTFSGTTFFAPNPAGGDQFQVANVPRQLVVMGGGSGGGNTKNVTFIRNIVSGTAGGVNSTGVEHGNTLVTIDSNGATITDNTFQGKTSRFATQLRARGPNTVITGNTFDSTKLYAFLGKATGQVYIENTGASLSAVANSNTFDRGVYVNGFTGTIGLSVKNYVQSAPGGSTINVLPGCYVETPQILVNRGLKLVGGGPSETFITPGGDTGASDDPRGWFRVAEFINMDVRDITFDGTNCLTGQTFKIYQAFRHRGSGTFNNVAFRNIKFDSYYGVAIAAFGTDSNVNVLNSDFSVIGRVGVLYFGSSATGNFVGNTYTGKGDGDFLDYALDISAGADIVVDNNVISGNRGVASSDGSTSACLLVTTYFGGGTTATITNNDLTDCTTGVYVGFNGADTSNVKLTGNTFSGALMSSAIIFTGPGATGLANRNAIVNADAGIVGVNFGQIFDGTCNWWNNASGPSGTGLPGTGTSVSGNVDVEPWLVTSDLAGECTGIITAAPTPAPTPLPTARPTPAPTSKGMMMGRTLRR